MDATDLDGLIDDYVDIAGGMDSASDDWPELWRLEKAIRDGSREVRYASRADREASWQRFSNALAQARAARDDVEMESARLRDWLVDWAHQAVPPSGLQEFFDGFIEGFIGTDDRDLLDNWRHDLQDRQGIVKAVRSAFGERKDDIVPKDRKSVYDTVKFCEAELQNGWERYKEARRDSIRQHLEEKISHQEGHIKNLYEKLGEARGGSYRERVAGWIEEAEEGLVDLREKLRELDD